MATPSLTLPPAPPPLTLGELAHACRCRLWTAAVFSQIFALIFGLAIAYYAYKSDASTAPLSSVPWLLALLVSFVPCFSLLCMVQDYAFLFLPRTPVAVFRNLWMWVVGVAVLGVMVTSVAVFQVRDGRVLASYTAVAHGFILSLVGFWVWLACTYGGDSGGDGDALDAV